MVSLRLFSAALVCAGLALAQAPPITVNVDASEASRRLIKTTMHFPVAPGPFSLRYPQWIPGEHGPTGPIEDLVGIKVTGNGQPIAWTRDPVNMYEFHMTVPPGVSTIK